MFDRLSSLNTRLKLSETVSLLLSLMVILAVVNIVVIYTYHQDAERLGNSVNVAGQQRMLSQRMVRFANEIADGDDPNEARERLRVAVERYDRNLRALEHGGTVFDTELNPGHTRSDDVPSVTLQGERLDPAPDATTAELRREREQWEAYRPHIRTILTADPDDPEFRESLGYVRTNSDNLLSVSDTVTAEFARVVRVQRTALRQVLVVLLGVDILVALLGVAFAHRFVGRPMARIARRGRELAAGDLHPEADDLSLPIDEEMPQAKQRAELAQLSRSFAALQGYLQTVSAQAESLARREFDAPVLDERVPGELGDSLETMREDLQAYIRELQETTEELDAVIEASPDAIYITDTQGRVQRWNPAAEEMFGWSEQEVRGEPNPIVPEETREEYRDDLYRVISGESLAGVERRRQTKAGDRIDVSISTATMSGPGGDIVGVTALVEDISQRKERERTLRRQRDELQMLNRVNDLVLEITQELLNFSNRERIEDLVCERLAESDLYEFAWIGDARGDADGVTIRAAAGVKTEALASLTLGDGIDGSELEPVRRAYESGEIHVVPDVTDGVGIPPEAREAMDITALAAVPLTARDAVYGVLTVYTTREYAFRQRERSGLTTLGKTIGFAINAIQNRKLLFADTVVDLTFDVGGSDLPLVPTARTLDCRLSLDGFVAGTDSETLDLYVELDGATADQFASAVRDEPAVADADVIADEENHRRVAVTLGGDSAASLFSEEGAIVHAIELDGATGKYVLEVPLSADVAAVVEGVRAAYPGVDFVAKRERERSVSTAAELATAIRDRLTDRQYEVFKTAYFGGYFEWPRDRTIEDLAASMGIAGSTFHHHLRHAQRKLAEALFATEPTAAVPAKD